ncbi:protein ENHANCED DISEASE RESISTANCE 2-like [Andrographis paniculata]|uniref:protein ENHANCED DISEASE RESISTANCE 2-like n=1 Tax=Andrographis paniculata TaxID=175694 RepID=UPI0021E925C5|nr:protein ENHANCED DISEASE RESISTANCE 2-like [Andrographis paniculata]
MGMVEIEDKMKGWLYLFRHNRFGLQYIRKTFFILEDNILKSFKAIPKSEDEEPLRSAIIDSCIRVVDNGRESHHRKIFFTFTIYNTSNHNDRIKLGVTSSEEAARWIHALKDTALNQEKTSYSERKWQPFSMTVSKRMLSKRSRSVDWTSTSMHVNAMTSDVLAPSPWKIFGCQNGLRIFKEARDKNSSGKHWDENAAVMAVGVIDGAPESVFRTIMSLGASRTEWDFSFYRGSVVENLDGHTDIIHIQLYNHWLPWGTKRRDLLLRRYWRREDDGTYVILYHSVVNRKCPPQPGYVRACLQSGGYLISPIQQGKQCVIKHMLAIDWKFWKSYLKRSSARFVTIQMLNKIAALRELYRVQSGSTIGEYVSAEPSLDRVVSESNIEAIKRELVLKEEQKDLENEQLRPQLSEASTLSALSDAADEFFDVPEPSDDDTSEVDWQTGMSPEYTYVEDVQPKLSSAANFVKKLHGLAGQKKGYMELQDISREESVCLSYGSTLPKDSSHNMPCSWSSADPSSFLIRGNNYLVDNHKVKASGTLLEMIAADWLQSDKPEYDIAGRQGSIVQKYASLGGPEFFFVINIQVPGATMYNLALYYMLRTPIEKIPLLERFVNSDDTFRNSRLKLIPYISKGSWIVKQSVGKKSCLIGQALETKYFRGKNYLEVCIDVGSSTVARGVVSLVLGYLNNLVVEMAFLLQGNTEKELPEFLLGTCRLNYLDASKAVSTDSIHAP